MSRVQLPVVAQDAAGSAVSGASVSITNRQTGQAPVVYTTETGGASRSLPLTTGANGRPPESWVDRAAYLITVQAAAVGTDVLAWDGAAARDASVDAAWLSSALRPSQGAPPGTEALRAIGTGAGQVVAGDDLSLTNQRAPTDNSVGWAKTGAGINGLADQAVGVYRVNDYAAGAGSIVQFDSAIYNNGASFPSAGGKFTCTRTGLYEFNARVSTTTNVLCKLWIGGDPMDEVVTPGILHAARQMLVGQEAYVVLDTAATVRGGRGVTHFNGRMIGR